MLLARHGLRVLVVERGRYGADTLSTHALMRGGAAAAPLGTARPCHRRRYAAHPPPMFVSGDERLTSRSSHLAASTPCTCRGGRSSTRSSSTRPSPPAPSTATASPSTTFAAIATGASPAWSGATDARGTELGSIVIGADGTRSTIAELVGPDRARVPAPPPSSTATGPNSTRGYESISRPGAAAGIIPTNDGERAFRRSTPRRIGRAVPTCGRLYEAEPDLGARVTAADHPSGCEARGRPGFLRRSWGPGWAFVGDAGYWEDPLTAHGLTDALRDAELLCHAVTAVASGAHEAKALAGYQSQRDRLSADLFAVTDAIARHRWTADEIGGLLRRLSASMSDEVVTLEDLVPVPTG